MMLYYVDSEGVFLGGWDEGAPAGGIPVAPAPEYADQLWLFPGWSPSRMQLAMVEDEWRVAELAVIATQLLSLEEAEAALEEGEPLPPDLRPGTRNQWLAYRTKVRAWKDTNSDFPLKEKRPTAPALQE
ncbi:tail fiber assembly protein [Pseudomonas phage phi2]|uniref:Hypothetical phage protein n=1 Tax=Pseudomonas phage phi2 TaxID=1450169 RepID=D2EBU5_9CAUD|nr:tail fiber assembly protein [Pseudomonas phage phi-2]CBH51607.1 hypothetical phage protein [Pseudomonas phage phi-2]